MTSKEFRKRMLGAGSALRVLAMIGAGAAAGGVAITPAMAQDYTSGSVAGTVTDESGNAVAGATVTLTSQAQGFTRTATTSSNGGFRFVGLPTGAYDLVVDAEGLDAFTATGVSVLASQTATVNIGLTTTGNEIIVTGAAIVQDFTGTTTGVNVDIDEMVKTVPISRDLTSVVLLAPGTSAGDSAFGNLASIAGASVAENAYYVNGLNITNFDNYLGSAEVPFDFLRTVDVKSGGYPAEFGRATGGIVNQTTKSGGNDFFAAAHLYWEPNFLRSSGKDLQTCDFASGEQEPFSASPNVTCENTTNRSQDREENRSLVLEAGGPLVKDRLFLYGLVEFRKETSQVISGANTTNGTAYLYNTDDPFWGLKVDAYPVDGHHFEFTIYDTGATTTRQDRAYSEPNNTPTIGAANAINEFYTGGVSYVGKYTGEITDFLTVSGAYGVMQETFESQSITAGSDRPYFQNASGVTVAGQPNGGFYTGQRLSLTSDPYYIEREFFRGDVDLYFSLFGEHHIRAGYDQENNTLVETRVTTGGSYLCNVGFLSAEACSANAGGAGARMFLLEPDVVQIEYYNTGGSFDARNKAFYIQDEWDVTDRLTLNLGLRRDDFSVNRADGVTMIDQKENYAPRLGFSYDLFEDHSATFYGFIGDYYLPIASNTAYRMTGSEYYFREVFEFEGVDSNGLPILGAQINDYPQHANQCPIPLTSVSSGGRNCGVTGDGSVQEPGALISSTLSATKVREWILGYTQTFNNVPLFGELKLGINYTNRRLKANAEDVAVDAAVLAYCEAEGIEGCSSTWTGFHQYVVINPGQDATFELAGLDGREVTLTAEQLGYPAASRKYDAVELTFERPFDGSWSIGGSYTWSKSRGNSEGFVQSDFGQDDAGITQDFDQPGFTDGAFGRLPSDRRHRLKLWGAYAITEGLTVGTNVRIDSPRPLSCFGFDPRGGPVDLPWTGYDDTGPYGAFGNLYGAASHFCGGELSERGTAQKSDWIYNVDFKVAYEMQIPSGQTVRLRADVFNIFNFQGAQELNEFGELETPVFNDDETEVLYYVGNPNYGQTTTYQSPRYVRLGMDIEF